MIANGPSLTAAGVLTPMIESKLPGPGGVSHGMSEAGYDIRIAQDIVLHPFRRFRLASTMERFQMPTDMVAIIHDKSTWARRGLSGCLRNAASAARRSPRAPPSGCCRPSARAG